MKEDWDWFKSGQPELNGYPVLLDLLQPDWSSFREGKLTIRTLEKRNA